MSSDLWALERAAALNAQYHVLGGTLSPLDGIGPDQLNIRQLVSRVAEGEIREVILAVNATVEGQTTAHYLTDQLSDFDVKDDAAGAWRAGRRRTRLSRRGHACRGAEVADRVLTCIAGEDGRR